MSTHPKRIAVFPGTFDPLTLGHVSLIERGLACFDQLIVAVTEESTKHALFSIAERIELIQQSLDLNIEDQKRLRIDRFQGLLVDYMKTQEASIIFRGLRSVTDFEYELQMAHANRMLGKGVETVFMMTEGIYSHLSSSLIKEIARLNGSLEGMAPPTVAKALKAKFASL